jgi:ribosomal protein S18 acetylase RimI-like enzyme
MHNDSIEKIKIVELKKDDKSLPTLKYRHVISEYYNLKIVRKPQSWQIELTLEPIEKAFEKKDESILFADYVEEPRVFAAEMDSEQVGWIELGYQKWNNRMRVWEFLVKEGFRQKRVGTLLMNHAVKLAKEKGGRMLVLETQTWNVPAISFYLRFGFELIGFDAAAYSNEDIERKEVRLEFGLKIQ